MHDDRVDATRRFTQRRVRAAESAEVAAMVSQSSCDIAALITSGDAAIIAPSQCGSVCQPIALLDLGYTLTK